MNPQTKIRLIFLGLLVVIGVGVGGYFGIDALIKTKKISPFKPYLQEYLAQPRPGVGGSVASAYIKGKVITVDLTKRDLDWLFFDLPSDLQAKNPEEVGTVVWLQWGEEKDPVGYTDNTDAIWRTVTVTIIDKAQNTVIGTYQTRGGPPPENKEGAGNGYGSKPDKEVVNYLKNLPQR